MRNIARNTYVSHIAKYLSKGLILALTGQRRVGKSYILMQAKEYIEANIENSNVVYINKERKEYDNIRNYVDLQEYVDKELEPTKENFLLIDEVQDIDGFEHTLRSLNSTEECQIIVTGSNAKMLSSELSTYLSGRYIEIHIQSLSYSEFLEFHRLDNTQGSLEKYLKYGGMPYLCNLDLGDEDMIWEYLQNIYNTIVLKDVVQREAIRNISLFENLMIFASDNVGQLLSANSISKYLKSDRIELSPLRAINYLKSACNAYLLSKVRRYDIRGKKVLESNEKYYFEDLGLRNLLLRSNRDIGIEKLMENAVYLHLKNCGYVVEVGNLPNREIDFVATKKGSVQYFQVTYLLQDTKTIEREFGNLSNIGDNFPKYVISMEKPFLQEANHKGIIQISLRDFLSKEI